jgi:hypothetical protein
LGGIKGNKQRTGIKDFLTIMHLRRFVIISSVVLVAWLAVTFVHEVPSPRYTKPDEHSAKGGEPATAEAGKTEENHPLTVSVSH